MISFFFLTLLLLLISFFFFFNDTATTEIYTLSLHDALPIYIQLIEEYGMTQEEIASEIKKDRYHVNFAIMAARSAADIRAALREKYSRSEEHTSELQSRSDLVCRLLLEKKKKKILKRTTSYT